MYFCPNCNNVFDITKGTSQAGGEIQESSSEDNNMTTTSSLNIKEMFGGAKGGKDDAYDEIINKLMKTDKIDKKELDKFSLEELMKSDAYKKLKHKQKEHIFNKIQDMLPIEQKKLFTLEETKQQLEKAYFICNNCGNRKPIEKGTLIFSKVSSDIAQSYSSSDVGDMKYSDILPRTRKYICPNAKCESHTNPQKREAVFFRMNNTFRVKHICQACDTVF